MAEEIKCETPVETAVEMTDEGMKIVGSSVLQPDAATITTTSTTTEQAITIRVTTHSHTGTTLIVDHHTTTTTTTDQRTLPDEGRHQ